jgi:hypothetical protein
MDQSARPLLPIGAFCLEITINGMTYQGIEYFLDDSICVLSKPETVCGVRFVNLRDEFCLS